MVALTLLIIVYFVNKSKIPFGTRLNLIFNPIIKSMGLFDKEIRRNFTYKPELI